MTTIDRARLAQQLELEQQRFVDTHPRSHELFERAQKSLLAGVPMSWMVKWAGSFPVFVTERARARTSPMSTGMTTSICVWAIPAR